MSDEQKPRLYMVTVEFEVPVLATSREAAEEHASHDYDIWSDMRGDAGHVHAREITKAVQESSNFPGQIRVTVIRETRAIEFARSARER